MLRLVLALLLPLPIQTARLQMPVLLVLLMSSQTGPLIWVHWELGLQEQVLRQIQTGPHSTQPGLQSSQTALHSLQVWWL